MEPGFLKFSTGELTKSRGQSTSLVAISKIQAPTKARPKVFVSRKWRVSAYTPTVGHASEARTVRGSNLTPSPLRGYTLDSLCPYEELNTPRTLQYRGTSLMRNNPFLGPYSKIMPRAMVALGRRGVAHERGTPVGLPMTLWLS